MQLISLTARPFQLPLREPLRLATGDTLHTREGRLLIGASNEGQSVVAEASPLPGFSREDLSAVDEALTAFQREYLPFLFDPHESCFDVWRRLPELPDSLRFALAMVLAQLQAQGRPLHTVLAPASSGRLRCNALLTGSREACLNKAKACQAEGFRCVKLKVLPQGPDATASLVNEVAAILGAGARIRVDVNRLWEQNAVTKFFRAVDPRNIDYLEEPVADRPALRAIAEAGEIPYALDESLREPAPVEDFVLRRAKALLWKPTMHFDQPILDIVERHRAGSFPERVISSAFESGIGIAHLSHLAAAFSGGTPAGLDTYAWLGEDVLLTPLSDLAPESVVYSTAGVEDLSDGRFCSSQGHPPVSKKT